MLNPLHSEISYLNRVKAQSEVLVPILNCLRTELGEERANALIYGALREWSREAFAEAASAKKGSGYEIWQAMDEELAALTGNDITYETQKDDSSSLELDVTRCKFAQFFKALGEPELGSILACEVDHHLTAASQQEVHLEIDKRIMKGDELCDFRYKFEAAESGNSNG